MMAALKPRPPEVTSKIMAAVRSKDTEPEKLLRRALFRRGLRFRVHDKRLPGRPDIVFPRQRVAVFVDGDFWHGSGWKERGFPSMEAQFRERADFWVPKIRANVRRDRTVNAALDALGWTVIRLWESDVRRALNKCVRRVARLVLGRKASK